MFKSIFSERFKEIPHIHEALNYKPKDPKDDGVDPSMRNMPK